MSERLLKHLFELLKHCTVDVVCVYNFKKHLVFLCHLYVVFINQKNLKKKCPVCHCKWDSSLFVRRFSLLSFLYSLYWFWFSFWEDLLCGVRVCVCVDGPTLVTKYHDSINDHSKHCCHSIVLLTTQNKRTGLDLRFGFVGPTFKGRFGFTKSLWFIWVGVGFCMCMIVFPCV